MAAHVQPTSFSSLPSLKIVDMAMKQKEQEIQQHRIVEAEMREELAKSMDRAMEAPLMASSMVNWDSDGVNPNAFRKWPQSDQETEILRVRVQTLENELLQGKNREAEAAARIRVLEADKKRLEGELSRRKPRLGEARTVED